MSTVYCYNNRGDAVPVAAEVVQFRPAVYGIFINENEEVLLQRRPANQLLHPPGRILASYETPVHVLLYYFRQLTGFTPHIGPLLSVERKYHIDEEERAWELSLLFYALDRPPMTYVTSEENEEWEETRWHALNTLNRREMQFGYEAVQAARLRLDLA